MPLRREEGGTLRREGDVRGGEFGVSVEFSPLDLGPHAWFRETYSAGTWSDLSVNGNDIIQGIGAKQPTQVARYGQSVLSLDGGDSMEGAFHAALTQPFSVFVVGEFTNFDGLNSSAICDADDLANRMLIEANQTSGALRSNSGLVHPGQTAIAATVFGACIVFNGASSEWYLDDFTDGAVDSGNAGTQTPDGLTIGSHDGGAARFMTGFLAEFSVFDFLPTTAQRKSMGDYFTARYTGLAVTT